MAVPGARHDQMALPADLFGARRNSAGLDVSDETTLGELSKVLAKSADCAWRAAPLPSGSGEQGASRPVLNPGDRRDVVGHVTEAAEGDVGRAMAVASLAREGWAAVAPAERAAALERAADIMQRDMPMLLGLIMREAGKSLPNAIAEVREAIDFLRYYADQARRTLGASNKPLGPIVCISPWNFPLAIFTGQIAAALVAGNPVLAKPAEETPLIAAQGVRILYEAGIPLGVLQFLPGDGRIGAALVASPDTCGVMFTGSTEVARLIQAQLAAQRKADPADCRDRRPECDGRRFLGVGGTGRSRCHRLGVRQRRPALFGLARPLPSGRSRRPHARHVEGCVEAIVHRLHR